jgi:histone-lysine N-methyltransferase SETMAR
MDLKSITLFLGKKYDSAQAVFEEINEVLGPGTIGYSTVTEHLRLARFPPVPKSSVPTHRPSIVDGAILKALSDAPFSSIRELAKATCFPVSTVYRHLTQHLGFVLKHLRWVPHELTADQKGQRVALSKQLLALLQRVSGSAEHRVVTLDESWFYLYSDHEAIWLQADQEPPERTRHTIQDEKVMVTIVWSVDGFHVVDHLPNGVKFNADYYANHILIPLLDSNAFVPPKKLIVHADNAPVHRAEKCQKMMQEFEFERAPHPPYSPDLAPSDFFLFGYVNDKLRGKHNQDREELMDNINEILMEIPRQTLTSVFAEWTMRLRWVIKHKVAYFQKGKE